MVGILSYWEGNFSGAMLNFGRVMSGAFLIYSKMGGLEDLKDFNGEECNDHFLIFFVRFCLVYPLHGSSLPAATRDEKTQRFLKLYQEMGMLNIDMHRTDQYTVIRLSYIYSSANTGQESFWHGPVEHSNA